MTQKHAASTWSALHHQNSRTKQFFFLDGTQFFSSRSLFLTQNSKMESKIDGQVKGWDKRLANELMELLQHKSDEGRWGQAMLHSDLQDVSLLSTTAHATSKTKKV